MRLCCCSLGDVVGIIYIISACVCFPIVCTERLPRFTLKYRTQRQPVGKQHHSACDSAPGINRDCSVQKDGGRWYRSSSFPLWEHPAPGPGAPNDAGSARSAASPTRSPQLEVAAPGSAQHRLPPRPALSSASIAHAGCPKLLSARRRSGDLVGRWAPVEPGWGRRCREAGRGDGRDGGGRQRGRGGGGGGRERGDAGSPAAQRLPPRQGSGERRPRRMHGGRRAGGDAAVAAAACGAGRVQLLLSGERFPVDPVQHPQQRLRPLLQRVLHGDRLALHGVHGGLRAAHPARHLAAGRPRPAPHGAARRGAERARRVA